MNDTTKRTIGSPGDHLANERTFLAWIRTAIAVMAFGFVVVKFSLCVRQIALAFSDKGIILSSKGYSGWIGLFFVALGSVMTILAFIRYRRIEQQLNNETYKSSGGLLLWLTVITLLGSFLLVAYLLQNIYR